MIVFAWKLSKNYVLELSCFHKIRNFEDGLTFCEIRVNYDRFKGDHNPKFEINLEICNYKIFEFLIYNVHHVDTF